MKQILFTLIFLIFLVCPSYAWVDVKFTPSPECEESIVDFIMNAKNNIDIAVYSINNDKIVSTLKNAYDRGIKLRILTDKLQAANKSSKVLDLYQYGIDIRVNSKHKIEHNKFAIYDNETVSTGSFNWTQPASDKNSENCVFLIKDKNSVYKYMTRFEELWLINSKEKSDKWFIKKLQLKKDCVKNQ